MADTSSMDEDFESDYKKYCVLQWETIFCRLIWECEGWHPDTDVGKNVTETDNWSVVVVPCDLKAQKGNPSSIAVNIKLVLFCSVISLHALSVSDVRHQAETAIGL